MNTFIDVAHRQLLNANHPGNNFIDTKSQLQQQQQQLSPSSQQISQSPPINQQQQLQHLNNNNNPHQKVQQFTNSNSGGKNSGRRKHQTYQTNGNKKRNFSGGTHNNNNNNSRTNGNINGNNNNSPVNHLQQSNSEEDKQHYRSSASSKYCIGSQQQPQPQQQQHYHHQHKQLSSKQSTRINSNLDVNDGRNYRRLSINKTTNNNVSTDSYSNKEEQQQQQQQQYQQQQQDSFDATNSTNTTSGISSNCSESSCDSSTKSTSHKNPTKLNLKTNAMDMRSTRLIITHPTAAQHSPAQISLLSSPNAKAIYSLDYLHQVGAQITDRYRTQPAEYFNGNSNRTAYMNGSNGGYRYNGASGNSVSTSSHVSDASISPPLSIASSGSSNNSGKSNRSSKSASRLTHRSFTTSGTTAANGTGTGTGATATAAAVAAAAAAAGGSTMTNHRNSIGTTQNLQQPQLGFYQSQNIPFFHSSSSNGMQQMFTSNISPNNHAQQPNHYIQTNSVSTFHPNNNYHSHNRNYQSNNGGNKKQWNSYNNRFGKNKIETNGNYNNVSSPPVSVSVSVSVSNDGSINKSNLNNKSMVALPARKESTQSTDKQIQTDKTAMKKSTKKDNDIESSTLSLKTFSLSDSEASNPKLKLPDSDYFRLPKAKSFTCTSSMSLPAAIVSSSTPALLLNGSSNSSSTSSITTNRTVSHPILLPSDNDSKLSSSNAPRTDGQMLNNHLSQRTKSEKNSTSFNFTYNGRPNFPSSTNFVNTGSMLTEEMLLNGTNGQRIRYMTGQTNNSCLPPVNEPPTFCASNYFVNSPVRTKTYANGGHNKRRSSTPNHRSNNHNSAANVNLNNARKQDEIETQRGIQYRSRINEIHISPSVLCNGSEWDGASQKIWNKYELRRQPQELYEKKTVLWQYLCEKIKTIFSRYSLYLVGSTISGFALDTSDIDMCLVSRLCTTLDPRGEAVYHLDKLRTHLQENCQTFLKNFNLIPAKVPILRFDDTHHNVEVDLNYNNCVGIRNSHLLHCYTQLDWRLQPLAVIVKLWAQHHDINNAKDLTISSYSLILMVIHYLQCGVQPAILPCLHAMYPDKFKKINDIDTINMNEKIDPYKSDNHQTLGELFHGFLEYYCRFNFEKHAISVRTAGLLPIDECRKDVSYKNDPNEWKQLCIEEPFDRSNTARSCCDEKIFERIRKVFYESWLLLGKTKDLETLFGEPLAPPAFNAIYDNYMQAPSHQTHGIHMEYMMR